jgi:membrane-associated phospholipid phosphatase
VSTANGSRNFRNLTDSLQSIDRLLLAFWCLLSLICLVMHARIPSWKIILAANVAASVAVCVLALSDRSNLKLLRWIHDWAAFPLVVFTYKEIHYLVGPIHYGRDYDRLLIAIDHALFKANPTEWLARFANPFVTEVLQIAYSLFYVLFLVAGVELYRRQDLSQFRHFRLTVVYGFFVSYLGYFSLPAVGPRFTLHDFSRINAELPGLFATPYLRWFVNIFESIQTGASNGVALASAQRDVFPSGHTMLTLITIILAYRFSLKVRHWISATGMLLIFATVYLRYHYFIDIVAGALLVLPCLFTADKIYSLFKGDMDGLRTPTYRLPPTV